MTEYKTANIEREMMVYGYDKMVKSHCRMCHGGCGALIYLKDGKVAKIAGDPDCPINHGTLCSKGSAFVIMLLSSGIPLAGPWDCA